MRILSVDGGGILGLVPALILAECERRTGRPLREQFDLVAGTSTGGIIATAIAAGIPAARIASLYMEQGPQIFNAPLKWRLRTGGGLWGPDYPQDGLRAALEEVFGELRLSDIPRETALLGRSGSAALLVPAYELGQCKAGFFKSWRVSPGSVQDHRLVDVCLATSAAPTFFPPAKLRIGKEVKTYVDGGLQCNNPSLSALAEVVKHPMSQGAAEVRKTSMLSLGCGELHNAGWGWRDASGWGKLRWIRPLISSMLDGPADVTDHYCRLLLPARYVRVQWPQIAGLEMDNASQLAIRAMREIASWPGHVEPALQFLGVREAA